MNEAETRAEHIDPALKAAGWGVVEGSRILREYLITPGRIEGHGRRGKALTADYVLVYRNRKLAVIEAKAWDKPLTEGVGQTKDYAAEMHVFLEFVLSHYVMVGVEELDQEKLTPLLRLKYHDSIADAVADLGRPEEIFKVFAVFQKYLYQPQAVA
jgi:type I site-specific restriction endonuclease